MNRRRQRWRRWCKRILRIAGGLAALGLLVFVLIQLFLSTSWLRGKVAAKLSQRIGGLGVEIADLEWTPWSGARIRGLQIEQPVALADWVPTPLLVVEEIHAWPDYGAALKGEWTVSEVTVVRPRVCVTAEMLISIASSAVPPAEPSAAVAVVIPGSNPAEVGVAEPPAVAVAPGMPNPEPKPPTVERSPPPGPRMTRSRIRMIVEDGGFEIVRAGKEGRLVAIEGMNFDLPLFGDAGETSSSIGLIESLGQPIAEDLKVAVESEGEDVSLLLADRPDEPSQVVGRIRFGLVRGLPFQADLGVRLPEWKRMTLSEELSMKSGEVQMRVQGGGWLQAPGSWRGASEFKALQVIGSLSGQPLVFDSATGALQLSAGLIQSPDFRLVGDSAAVLGNGWVNSRDGAAVLRVVIPYSQVSTLNGELSKRVPDSVFAFKPLKPDNRWYSDVSLWREEDGWSIGFGDRGTVMKLDELTP